MGVEVQPPVFVNTRYPYAAKDCVAPEVSVTPAPLYLGQAAPVAAADLACLAIGLGGWPFQAGWYIRGIHANARRTHPPLARDRRRNVAATSLQNHDSSSFLCSSRW